ncbi:hypothetical protein [Streptomyces sp. NPDC005859]|uniref:hypothetical protein n=1 Tax=Streptomyces sp. NPDC005859 TaxID=3157170 RepID=UPI0033FE546B
MTLDLTITDDMLHTVLRRRTGGETVEQIEPDLLIPTGRRKVQNPSLSSIYRALAEHEKAQAYPDALEAAHADSAAKSGKGSKATVSFPQGQSRCRTSSPLLRTTTGTTPGMCSSGTAGIPLNPTSVSTSARTRRTRPWSRSYSR